MTKTFVFAMLMCFSVSAFGWPKIQKPSGPTPPKVIELARFPNDPMPKPHVPPPLRALVLTAATVAKITCMNSGSTEASASVAVFAPEDVQSFSVVATDSLHQTVSLHSEAIDRTQDSSCKLEVSERDFNTRSAEIAL